MQIEVKVNFKNFNLTVREKLIESKINVIMGESGCGKSTLLKALSGFLNFEGKVIFKGKNLKALKPYEKNLGIMFQENSLFPNMSLEENIYYSSKNSKNGLNVSEINNLIEFFELERIRKNKVYELSGGEKQRGELARLIASGKELLLLDEPLSALDQHLKEKALIKLKKIQKEKSLTIVYITHERGEALKLADYIFIMDKGEIIERGERDKVLNSNLEQTISLLDSSNFFPKEWSAKHLQINKDLIIKKENIILKQDAGLKVEMISSYFNVSTFENIAYLDKKFIKFFSKNEIKDNFVYLHFKLN